MLASFFFLPCFSLYKHNWNIPKWCIPIQSARTRATITTTTKKEELVFLSCSKEKTSLCLLLRRRMYGTRCCCCCCCCLFNIPKGCPFKFWLRVVHSNDKCFESHPSDFNDTISHHLDQSNKYKQNKILRLCFQNCREVLTPFDLNKIDHLVMRE